MTKANSNPTAETPVLDSSKIALSELDSVNVQPQVLREVILALQANQHHSTANTKRRGEVSGGGRKPWRQKGTGRARTGSSRNPLWRGGGITFGPLKTKNYHQNISPAVRRQALLAALKLKLQAGKISSLQLDQQLTKTKLAAKELLGALSSAASALIVITEPTQAKPLRNIAGLRVITVGRLNALDVVSARQIIFINQSYTDLKTKLGV